MRRIEIGSIERPEHTKLRRSSRVLLLPLVAALSVMCSDEEDEIPVSAAVGEAGESSSSAGASAGGRSSAGEANASGAPGHDSGGGGLTAQGGTGAGGEAGGPPARRCHVELAPKCLGAVEGSGGEGTGAAVMSAVAAFEGVQAVHGLNDHGQFVGSMDCDSTTHAFMSDNGIVHDLLNGLGDLSSQAVDINNQGVVIGNVAFDLDEETGTFKQTFPFIWEAGETLVLRDVPGARAVAINEQGQILLRANGSGALVWDDGVVSELGPLVSGEDEDINNLGQVVGALSTGVGFVWEGGVMTELPELRAAHAINDAGQIVGISADGKPVLLDGTELTELALHGPPIEITNDGKVLGMRSVLSEGVLTELSGRLGNDLFGTSATDINEAGLIIGVGEVTRFHPSSRGCRQESCEILEHHAVIWTPTCYDSCCGEASGGAGGGGGQAGQ